MDAKVIALAREHKAQEPNSQQIADNSRYLRFLERYGLKFATTPQGYNLADSCAILERILE